MALGHCRLVAPETMFPTDSTGVVLAQRVCATCPVKLPCLEYALATHIEHGVWGGTSSRQRSRINRDRRTVPAA
jgi:WhiB family transcriptional regulator, redox-sensing transcriptional regulator